MAKWKRFGTCRSEADTKVIKEVGTYTLGAYIDKWQVIVTDWVVLRPILDIWDIKMGYKGGGRLRELW